MTSKFISSNHAEYMKTNLDKTSISSKVDKSFSFVGFSAAAAAMTVFLLACACVKNNTQKHESDSDACWPKDHNIQ